MADTYTLADLMRERYGEGYVSPALNSGDSEIYDTSNIRARMPEEGTLAGLMRSFANRVRGASRNDNVLAGGVDSAANWIEGRPQVGQDTAAPLGAGGMLAAFMARPRPRFTPPTEWPVEAALRIGDQTFTGPHHWGAMLKAQEALGESAADIVGRLAANGDGFITNTGRYVTRTEAGRLADGDYARSIPYMSEALGLERDPIRTNYGWGSTSATGGAIPGSAIPRAPDQGPHEADELWWRTPP